MSKKHQKSAREIKEEKVQNLTEKIAKAKSIAFANYHGLTAEQINGLRQKIKEAGGELLVEKNSLIKLALKSNKMEAPEEHLVGPTSATLAYDDEITPIKEVAASNKTLGFPTFKFGFFGKDLLDTPALITLSQTPSKQILQANLVGSLVSPIYGFVNVLSANIRSLVSILDQVSKKANA